MGFVQFVSSGIKHHHLIISYLPIYYPFAKHNICRCVEITNDLIKLNFVSYVAFYREKKPKPKVLKPQKCFMKIENYAAICLLFPLNRVNCNSKKYYLKTHGLLF